MMPSDAKPVSNELFAKANIIADERFSRSAADEPAVAALKELCVLNLAQALASGAELSLTPKPAQASEPQIDFSARKRSLLEIKPPPLPQVYLELTKVVNDPYKTAKDAGELIIKDPGLSSYLLRLVNSPLYGLRDKVETISRAVAVVGMLQLHTLSMGRAAASMFDAVPRKDLLDMNLFWRHSLTCAIASRSLGLQCGSRDLEELFVSGLLHDMGKLLLALAEPDLTQAAAAKSRSENIPREAAEKAIFGFDHAELGGTVLRKWNLSENMAAAVGQHHPGRETQLGQRAALVHVADVVSHALEPAMAGELMPEFSPRAWNSLGLAPASLAQVAEDVREQLNPLLEVFQIKK